MSDVPPLIFAVQDDNENFNEIQPFELSPNLKNYLEENFTQKELSKFSSTNNFYEISFNKPGGLVMPIIVEYTYEDGTSFREKYPAQIWRKNDSEYKRVLVSSKKIVVRGILNLPSELSLEVWLVAGGVLVQILVFFDHLMQITILGRHVLQAA